MNCREIEPLLLAERDGVLPPDRHAALAEHLAGCPACRHARAAYGEAVTFLKTDAANVAVPDATTEWREVRGKLDSRGTSRDKRRLAPVIWFVAPLAAAAAIAVAVFTHRTAGPIRPNSVAVTPVEAPAPSVPTIAYVDKDSGWLVVWCADADTKTNG